MARQRMYLFERAYVDYIGLVRRFGERVWGIGKEIWLWFWAGPGATGIEYILRILIIIAAAAASVLFFRYENAHGRGLAATTLMTIIVIIVFTTLILWGWKAVIHFLARTLAGAFALGVILVLTTLSFLAFTTFFVPYLLVLFVLTVLSFSVFVPMRFAHWIWLTRRKITYRCPWDDCSYSGLPIHTCSCGHRYDDLQPSFYGIFYHVCRHDRESIKLPTMDFLGRNKLIRLCGRCERKLAFTSIGELAEWPIALAGGPTAGKTIFLRQATCQLQMTFEELPGSKVYIESKEQRREYAYDLERLDRGQVVEKTSGDVRQAFGLTLSLSKERGYLLYLFDAPGEQYTVLEQLGRKQAFQDMQGIILLVDPFSLPALADYAQLLDVQLQPSQAPFQRVVDVLIQTVNLMLVQKPTDQCEVPLAIVLSKVDALPVDDFAYLKGLNRDTVDDAFHAHCRQALDKLGARYSLHALERKFSRVQYFACTGLGRMPNPRDTRPFRPVGVTAPFLWLLGLDDIAATPAWKS